MSRTCGLQHYSHLPQVERICANIMLFYHNVSVIGEEHTFQAEKFHACACEYCV